ncbi:MAG: hypothetical protein AAF329_17255 [Cyanobacteria bacterium P01_A01_bin.17]
MATTRLSDVVEPRVYAGYQAENSPEKTAFFESGVAVTNPALTEKANTGGRILDVPFWKDLDANAEPNLPRSAGRGQSSGREQGEWENA